MKRCRIIYCDPAKKIWESIESGYINADNNCLYLESGTYHRKFLRWFEFLEEDVLDVALREQVSGDNIGNNGQVTSNQREAGRTDAETNSQDVEQDYILY